MAELREFQRAAVDRIVARLSDKTGTRRFLLADEVGLGKTLVAKGVVDRLQDRHPRRGFTVVYVCSNSEIAEQNIGKLCEEGKSAIPGRLTLLSLQSREIEARRDEGQRQVFAFTPGTSLHVEQGTGVAKERRLLLYLVRRLWRKRVDQWAWRRFFCCSSDEDKWKHDTAFKRLSKEFFRKVAGHLQVQLKKQWESQEVKIVEAGTGKESTRRLSECMDGCVSGYIPENPNASKKWNKDRNKTWSRNRNRIIGELRKGLAKVALEFLQPQLVVLDEFQKFSEILVSSRDRHSIVGRLLASESGAILVLSATPYKMFTLPYEELKHEEEFLKTIAFLMNMDKNDAGIISLKKDLLAYRDRLVQGEWGKCHDAELYACRGRIEDRLKQVMCRTERNWYLDDEAKGVTEFARSGVSAERGELAEYVRLKQFLLSRKVGDWNITDFWKSAPSVLSFMDANYGLSSRIRRDRLQLPPEVLRSEEEFRNSAGNNAKFRMFFEKIFGQGWAGPRPEKWKYLWLRPTYMYYPDEFFGAGGSEKGETPAKFLVFSHWRFVPKAIAVLTSHELSRRLPRHLQRSKPLQFRKKLAFYPFDVCYPSLALASINPFRLARGEAAASPHEIFLRARKEVETLLEAADVKVCRTRKAPLWKVIARIESSAPGSGDGIKNALGKLRVSADDDTSLYLSRHAEQYADWIDDKSPLSISPVWVDRLTQIALYSPAVTFMRAFISVFPEQRDAAWPAVLEFCLGSLRNYFNKTLVQAIIRKHGGGKSYTEAVCAYCRKAHFQAVMDEYAYLARNVLQKEDAGKFLKHMAAAMGMWSGKPGVNRRTRDGRIAGRPRHYPSHFALAFGDEVSSESQESSQGKRHAGVTSSAAETSSRTRKSVVRDAFNSPFWPFVLSTTSVGQEGLDFHLYCRDIVHWNLPSNPVDLEQREGRINRFDGLSIRRNIGLDNPLCNIDCRPGENLWSAVFREVEESSPVSGRFKHGLFPHWIYMGRSAGAGESADDRAIIRRHLLFYARSSDRQHYDRLKDALALYRLVFGQPRQQDVLEQVVARNPGLDRHSLGKLLARYMINLSPFEPKHARRRALREARKVLAEPAQLAKVLDELPDFLGKLSPSVQSSIQTEIDALTSMVKDGNSMEPRLRRKALAALLYLLDPFDEVHDSHGEQGFEDDKRVIRRVYADIRRGLGGSSVTVPPRLIC